MLKLSTILKEPSNYLVLQRRLVAPEILLPLENQTSCNVEVSYLPQILLNIQAKFLQSEVELHRIRSKKNKLDYLDALLDHYEKLHGWKKSVVTPLRLYVKSERMKKLRKTQERKKKNGRKNKNSRKKKIKINQRT